MQQAISNILVFLFLLTFAIYIYSLFKPENRVAKKVTKGDNSRKNISIRFISVIIALFFVIGIVSPASAQVGQAQKSNQASSQDNSKKTTSPDIVTTSDVTSNEDIPFSSQTQDDSSLPVGQSQISQVGVNGTKEVVYEVTAKNGKEISRSKKSEKIIKQSIDQITKNGTYVQPVQNSTSAGSYVNSKGNQVESPSSDTDGATALCRDGARSHSQSRRGTCSHHGGVASWL